MIIIVAAKCEIPIVNSNVSLEYNLTVEGSQLILWCSDGLFPSGVILAECTSRGTWMPDHTELECSVSPKRNEYHEIIIIIVTEIIILSWKQCL